MEFKDFKEDHKSSILVGRKKIEYIAYNFKISEHAELQLLKHNDRLDHNLKMRILGSPLAWKTRNNCYAIALSLYEYVVVSDPNVSQPVIVTYVNTKKSEVTVVDKMFIAYKKSFK